MRPNHLEGFEAPMTRPISASERLAEAVRDLIVEQGLGAGTRLGSERDLIRSSGLSRPTVREAIRVLERDGLVSVKPGPGGGVIVRGLDHLQATRALGHLLEYEGTPPHDFLEAREEIESMCARLAARHGTGEDVAALAQTCDDLRASDTVDSAFIAEVNLRFHLGVAHAAHNHVLLRITQSLIDLVLLSAVRVEYTPEVKRALIHAHERIVAAIRDHDPAAADRRMRRHMAGFEEHVKRTGQMERLKQWSDPGDGLLARLRGGLRSGRE
jgi:DNA-binding FadR family transcriptional regulator